MDGNALVFFNAQPQKMALYQALVEKLSRLHNLTIKRRKSNDMLVFCNKNNFAYIMNTDSDGNPLESGFTLVFSATRQINDSCIVKITQPRKNRWSHHIYLNSAQDITNRLIEWLEESYQEAG